MDEAQKKIDDVVTANRKLQALPDVAGFLVSPDVWDYLAATIPIVRGSSTSFGGLQVTRVQSLPTRSIVPVDRKGRPLERPRALGGRLSVYLNDVIEWVVAESEEDASKVVAEFYGEPDVVFNDDPDWRKLPDDHLLTVDFEDEGIVTKTCAEWVLCRGRGYLATTER